MRPQPHMNLGYEMSKEWTIREALAWMDQRAELNRELEDIDRMAERTAKGGRKGNER